MKSSLRKTHLVLTSLIVMTVLFTFSCKKEGPCEAIITITDSAGVAVRGATVILRQDAVVNPTTGVQANVYQEGVTDGYGKASFEFKLEAVLNIEASKGPKTGKDYIRLEQSKTVYRTVIIK